MMTHTSVKVNNYNNKVTHLAGFLFLARYAYQPVLSIHPLPSIRFPSLHYHRCYHFLMFVSALPRTTTPYPSTTVQAYPTAEKTQQTTQTIIPTPHTTTHHQPSSKSATAKAWFLGLGTVAVLTLVGGFLLQQLPQKPPIPVVELFNGLTEPTKKAGFTGLQPKRTLAETQAFCEAVMALGNSGLACQTMSCINSIRLYKKLAETEQNFDTTYLTRTTAFLGSKTNEVLKTQAFKFFKTLLPELYEDFLEDNTINANRADKFQTLLMPHFLAQYVFDRMSGSTATLGGVNTADIITTLKNLCYGNIDLLGGSGWRGGHMVSLVGIHETKHGCIDQLVKQLEAAEPVDPSLLNNIQLLIYDQAKSDNPFDNIPLQQILAATQKGHWFDLRIFAKQEALKQPLEKQIQAQLQWDISSRNFHQQLIRTGDSVFNNN